MKIIIRLIGEKMKKPIIGIIGKVQPQYDEDIWHRIDEFTKKLFKEFIEKC